MRFWLTDSLTAALPSFALTSCWLSLVEGQVVLQAQIVGAGVVVEFPAANPSREARRGVGDRQKLPTYI
jgi:hypothetical protein